MLRTASHKALALSVFLLPLNAAIAQIADEDLAKAPEVVVTATRTEESIATIPGAVTVVTGQQLREQMTAIESLGDALGKLVPGLTPGSGSGNFGQTLRGRGIAVLIDGVPQNTTRNVSRNLATIDSSAIERIEVVCGATAIYGDGATGGIINIITKRPVAEGRVCDSLSGFLRQGMSGKHKSLDYVLAAGLERKGGFFDAEGDRIPPDPHGQGGLADSDTWNVLAKLGVALDAQQRLQLMVNRYDSEQDTDFTTDPSVNSLPPRGQKARTLYGLQLEEDQATENTLASLDYTHADVAGHKLHGRLFYRDYMTRFFPVDNRSSAQFGNTINQSRLESEKVGGRLEIESPLAALGGKVLWGMDYTDELTKQPVSIMDPAAYDASAAWCSAKSESASGCRR